MDCCRNIDSYSAIYSNLRKGRTFLITILLAPKYATAAEAAALLPSSPTKEEAEEFDDSLSDNQRNMLFAAMVERIQYESDDDIGFTYQNTKTNEQKD